ncbi:hypothetical protein HBB16_21075 [Pseudonocardia sp. MCCB 268]|nr:hypothetical protein [Pseudonocardia cytotoxica]
MVRTPGGHDMGLLRRKPGADERAATARPGSGGRRVEWVQDARSTPARPPTGPPSLPQGGEEHASAPRRRAAARSGPSERPRHRRAVGSGSGSVTAASACSARPTSGPLGRQR